MRSPTSVAITGASSGIGQALAVRYAAPHRHLALFGRNRERLDETVALSRASGANISTWIVDSRDRSAMAEALLAIDAQNPIDLVIANAGISAGTGAPGGETEDQIQALYETNVTGVMNTIAPLIGPMTARRRGHLSLMSSLAGFRGFPGAPAYCGSKAAIRVHGEGLRVALAPKGVEVSVICPGFVESAMTASNRYTMPFLMPADRAATIIQRGIERNRGRIAFPWQVHWTLRLLTALPGALIDRLLTGSPSKGE